MRYLANVKKLKTRTETRRSFGFQKAKDLIAKEEVNI